MKIISQQQIRAQNISPSTCVDWITTMRTGAVASVSSKVLRKSITEIYGIVGLGNTARNTLLCILGQEPERKFPVKLIKNIDQAELFKERFKE